MHLLARFPGPNGKILIKEDRGSGARLYQEGGVCQSRVRAGGDADLEYVRLMATLLAGDGDVLLLGCGGGALASMLHRQARSVTVVDVNPISFELARTFFWMPSGIACIAADMGAFVDTQRSTFDAIGIDVGGPRFSYEAVLEPATIARLRRALRDGGRIAINISCETTGDPVPWRIADLFKAEGLDIWAFSDDDATSNEVNIVILASARRETSASLAKISASWKLARLTG